MVYLLGLQPNSISRLAATRGLSLPAMTKHVRVLKEAGLVTRRKLGRTTFLTLDRSAMRGLQAWLARYHAYWGNEKETLENYERYLAIDPTDVKEDFMKKFLVLFHDKWEMKPEVMDAWQTWFGQVGDRLVDSGNPFAAGVEVTHSGSRELSNGDGAANGVLDHLGRVPRRRRAAPRRLPVLVERPAVRSQRDVIVPARAGRQF